MPEQTALGEIRDDAASRKRFLKMAGGGGAAGARRCARRLRQ